LDILLHKNSDKMISREHAQHYQSAVYLNNSAVVMLSNGAYYWAMETLSDALSLIKTVVEPTDDSDTAMMPSHEVHKFVTLRVREAEQRLARLATKTTTQSPKTTAPLVVTCYDGSLSSCSLIPAFGAAQSDECVAITIDDSVNDELDRCIQVIGPAIMLSNFALAHWFVSFSLPTESSRKNLVDGALRMLDIGQAVLGVKQRTMRVTEGSMFLALVLAHNICCLHQNEESWRFGIDTKRSSQQLHILRELSSQMVHLTSAFIPVAGAA
jgi:hypothetical protein